MDTKKLRELAQAATIPPCVPGNACTDKCWRNDPVCMRRERDDGAFYLAANPAAVLALLDVVDAALPRGGSQRGS